MLLLFGIDLYVYSAPYRIVQLTEEDGVLCLLPSIEQGFTLDRDKSHAI